MITRGPIHCPGIPAMGQRVRFKAGFVVPESWTTEEKAVLLGAIVADNGGLFSISVCPDDRFAATAFDHLSTVIIGAFEVVRSTGATEGPRSPGPPTADAGADVTGAAPKVAVTLSGRATSPVDAPLAVGWKQYVGPGEVAFADPAQAATTATFTAPGTYTLLLSASDGVHTTAYSAVDVIEGQRPAFFTGETPLPNGVFNLDIRINGNVFGYYAHLSDPRYIHHFDLGYMSACLMRPMRRGRAFVRLRQRHFFLWFSRVSLSIAVRFQVEHSALLLP